jgi:1,4-alpha-glucan branching enzyme
VAENSSHRANLKANSSMKNKVNDPKHHEPDPQRTGADSHLTPVQFEFRHPTAHTVCVAGSFNEWQASDKPMLRTGKGHWLSKSFLAPGKYEYCLVVDGQWMPDPQAPDSVPNPYGGKNSVLTVGRPAERTELVDAIQPDGAKNLSPSTKNQPKKTNV